MMSGALAPEWRSFITVVFLAALFVRLAVGGLLLASGGENALMLGDSTRYLGLAQNLASGNGYRYDSPHESFRPPGYPLYLLPFVYFHLPLWLAALVQIVAASLIPILVIVFGLKYLPGVPPMYIKLAALFAALEPGQVFYSAVLMPDVFFNILFLAGLWRLLRWYDGGGYRDAASAALVFAAASYFRAAGTYLGWYLAAVLLAVWIFKRTLTLSRFQGLLVFLFIFVAAFLPWQFRNWRIFGDSSFVSNGGTGIYFYGAAFTRAVAEKRDYEAVKQELLKKAATEAPDPSDPLSLRNNRYYISRSWDIIRANPRAYFKSFLLGLNTLFFSGNYHYLLYRYGVVAQPETGISFSLILAQHGFLSLVKKIFALFASPYVLLAIGGKLVWVILSLGALAGAWHFRKYPLSKFFLMLVGYFVLTFMPFTMGVEARHRASLDPLIGLYFFAIIFALYDYCFRRHTSL